MELDDSVFWDICYVDSDDDDKRTSICHVFFDEDVAISLANFLVRKLIVDGVSFKFVRVYRYTFSDLCFCVQVAQIDPSNLRS